MPRLSAAEVSPRGRSRRPPASSPRRGGRRGRSPIRRREHVAQVLELSREAVLPGSAATERSTSPSDDVTVSVAPHCGTITLVASNDASPPSTRTHIAPCRHRGTKPAGGPEPPGRTQLRVGLQVDPGVGLIRLRRRRHDLGLAEGRAQQVDGVAADVHHRAAREVAVEADVAGCTTKWGMLKSISTSFTSPSTPEPIVSRSSRMKPCRRKWNPTKARRPAASAASAICSAVVPFAREGLLAQHVLARRERPLAPGGVTIGGSARYTIDPRIRQHRVVIAPPRAGRGVGERARPLRVARPDRHDLDAVDRPSRFDHRALRDGARPEDADPDHAHLSFTQARVTRTGDATRTGRSAPQRPVAVTSPVLVRRRCPAARCGAGSARHPSPL